MDLVNIVAVVVTPLLFTAVGWFVKMHISNVDRGLKGLGKEIKEVNSLMERHVRETNQALHARAEEGRRFGAELLGKVHNVAVSVTESQRNMNDQIHSLKDELRIQKDQLGRIIIVGEQNQRMINAGGRLLKHHAQEIERLKKP